MVVWWLASRQFGAVRDRERGREGCEAIDGGVARGKPGRRLGEPNRLKIVKVIESFIILTSIQTDKHRNNLNKSHSHITR